MPLSDSLTIKERAKVAGFFLIWLASRYNTTKIIGVVSCGEYRIGARID